MAEVVTKAQVKAAKKAYKADPENKALKKEYKKLKAQLQELEENKADSQPESPQGDVQEKETEAEEVENTKEEEAAVVQKDDDGKDTLFIANFSWDVNDDILTEALLKYVKKDEIMQIRWGEDKETGQFKGWGHVQFVNSDAAKRAFALNKTTLQGRELRVDLDKSRKRKRDGDDSEGKDQDKDKRAKYKLVPADAPAANPDNVDRCFVGNLSFKIDEAQLFAAFEKLGSKAVHVFWVTDRQSGNFYGSAFVTFDTANDAAMAVASSGAYILGRPCRIEYSPHKDPNREKSVKKSGPPPKPPSERPEGGTYTAFFGNLSYEIDDDAITKWCEEIGAQVKSIRWLTHADTGAFRGAGFLDFKTVECVDKIIAKNGEPILGRPVRVDYS